MRCRCRVSCTIPQTSRSSTAQTTTHPGQIPHEVVGNPRPDPQIPATLTAKSPAHAPGIPPIPAQAGSAKTGLSRRRSRVRVPSLPSFVQAVSGASDLGLGSGSQAVHQRSALDRTTKAFCSGEITLAQVGVMCFEGERATLRPMAFRAAFGGSLVLVASVLVTSGCANSARTASRTAWTSCTFSNPSSHGLDVRNFEVRGGETCLHASKLINGVEQGFEGGCGASCHVLRFTCHEHPGGLTHYPTGQGTGSYYAYSDAQCARDAKHTRWRVYVTRE